MGGGDGLLPTCRPADLPLVVSRLKRTVVGPTIVIGFPPGVHMAQIKERDALVAVDQGAVELDVVLNIGALRPGPLGHVYSPRGAEAGEIAIMRRVVGDRVGVKAAGGARTLNVMLAMLAAGGVSSRGHSHGRDRDGVAGPRLGVGHGCGVGLASRR